MWSETVSDCVNSTNHIESDILESISGRFQIWSWIRYVIGFSGTKPQSEQPGHI